MEKEKKRLKRKTDSSSASTPKKTSSDTSDTVIDQLELDLCGSPDFLSSQECFSIGWDWSGQIKGNRKPSIRLVERPKKRRNNSLELLECARPRRLIRNYDSEMNDDTAILDELKALAADFKRVPETDSPVASPPNSSQKRCPDVLITPTAHKSNSKHVSSARSLALDDTVPTKPIFFEKIEAPPCADSGIIIETPKENFNDLLDDSMGPDLLKFTQDLEPNFRQHESKTPNHKDGGLPSSKKKNKLSLSTKKGRNIAQSSACRRINDVQEDNTVLTKLERKAVEVKNSKEKIQDHGVLPRIEFDDFDEQVLLSLGEIDENELLKSKESPKTSASENVGVEACKESAIDSNFDDVVVSPEILNIIDSAEKKATQDSKETHPHDLLDLIDIQHESYLEKREKSSGSRKSQDAFLKKPSVLVSSKCTPEEIEKKRQEARKRLQLKKKATHVKV